MESLSDDLVLRLTTEFSKHAARIERGSDAENQLLKAQAKACGNKASIHQVRAVWESVMGTHTKAQTTAATTRPLATVGRSARNKKTHK